MILKTAIDMLLTLRREIDDLSPTGNAELDDDRLWSTPELYGYLDEGHAAWAKDTSALLGDIDLPLLVGQAAYTLPAYVHDVREGRLVSARSPVRQLNRAETSWPGDDYGSAAMSLDDFSSGTPRFMTFDLVAKTLVLQPIPVAVDTLRLNVVMLPKASFADGLPMASVDLRDARLVLAYAKYRAYDKQDLETLDKAQSDRFLNEYNRDVKLRAAELRRLRRRPGTVAYGGL